VSDNTVVSLGKEDLVTGLDATFDEASSDVNRLIVEALKEAVEVGSKVDFCFKIDRSSQ